jgi:uncharacterized protein YndB with AHSA1/START domain
MSQTGTETTSAHATTRVPLPPDRAFALFTDGIETWWDPTHHIIEAPLARMVLEPYVGGSLYDVGTDGSECRWSRVLAYDPPRLFVFSWDINLEWQLETDPAKCSEVAVTFTAEDGGTRVDLEHRHLDRHGEGWAEMRDMVGKGWQSHGLDRFAAAAAELSEG